MLISVIEHEDFAGTPDIDGVANPHATFFGLLWNNQAEVGAQDALGDATMGGDMIARAQNREPRSEGRHGFEEALVTGPFLFQLLAEAKQDEGALLPFGYFHLVGDTSSNIESFPVFQDSVTSALIVCQSSVKASGMQVL
jgi:hypothetical protein